MKTHPLRRKNGFTLIELLVVIAIIATLAGAGFAAANGAMQKAKKTTALATCVALESAVNNFFTEYGAMPDSSTADKTLDTITDKDFLKVLLGTETVINTRGIKFLNVKEGKANKNGLMYDTAGSAITGLYDPWGKSYKVRLDGNYNEIVEVDSGNGFTKVLNNRRAAALSFGTDGLKGTADDAKSW